MYTLPKCPFVCKPTPVNRLPLIQTLLGIYLLCRLPKGCWPPTRFLLMSTYTLVNEFRNPKTASIVFWSDKIFTSYETRFECAITIQSVLMDFLKLSMYSNILVIHYTRLVWLNLTYFEVCARLSIGQNDMKF